MTSTMEKAMDLAERQHHEIERLRANAAAQHSALERARGCITGLLARTPVRDVSETLAEVDAALAKNPRESIADRAALANGELPVHLAAPSAYAPAQGVMQKALLAGMDAIIELVGKHPEITAWPEWDACSRFVHDHSGLVAMPESTIPQGKSSGERLAYEVRRAIETGTNAILSRDLCLAISEDLASRAESRIQTGNEPRITDEALQRWVELCERGHGQTVAEEIRRAQRTKDVSPRASTLRRVRP